MALVYIFTGIIIIIIIIIIIYYYYHHHHHHLYAGCLQLQLQYLKQTMFLVCIVLQLFCIYNLCYTCM